MGEAASGLGHKGEGGEGKQAQTAEPNAKRRVHGRARTRSSYRPSLRLPPVTQLQPPMPSIRSSPRSSTSPPPARRYLAHLASLLPPTHARASQLGEHEHTRGSSLFVNRPPPVGIRARSPRRAPRPAISHQIFSSPLSATVPPTHTAPLPSRSLTLPLGARTHSLTPVTLLAVRGLTFQPSIRTASPRSPPALQRPRPDPVLTAVPRRTPHDPVPARLLTLAAFPCELIRASSLPRSPPALPDPPRP